MQRWSSASTSRTSALCLLKNSLKHNKQLMLGTGAEVKAIPYLWHPGPGIPSCVPSIASHLLVLTGLGFHFKRWHELRQSMLYPPHAMPLASPSHCLPAPPPPAPPSTPSPARPTAQELSWRHYPKVATAFSLGWSCSEKLSWEILLWQLSLPAH